LGYGASFDEKIPGAGFEPGFAFADKAPAANIHRLWICQPAVNILWQSAYAVLAVIQSCNSSASNDLPPADQRTHVAHHTSP